MIDLNEIKRYLQNKIRLKIIELINKNEIKMSKNYDLKK